jgi:hypothetical protein
VEASDLYSQLVEGRSSEVAKGLDRAIERGKGRFGGPPIRMVGARGLEAEITS